MIDNECKEILMKKKLIKFKLAELFSGSPEKTTKGSDADFEISPTAEQSKSAYGALIALLRTIMSDQN